MLYPLVVFAIGAIPQVFDFGLDWAARFDREDTPVAYW